MSPLPHRIPNLAALKNLHVIAERVGGEGCFQANWAGSEDGDLLFHGLSGFDALSGEIFSDSASEATLFDPSMKTRTIRSRV